MELWQWFGVAMAVAVLIGLIVNGPQVQCPFCKKMVSKSATVCPFCRSSLNNDG